MATLDTGFPFTIKPINNITPFTYRDGMTYLELLYKLRDYMTQQIVPEFNEEMARIIDEFNAGLGAWDTRFNDFMANLEAEIAALNDAGITQLINDELSNTRTALEALFMKKSMLPFNVKDYGAKGDGITDDTISIQNALNDAGVNGGTVYVPSSDDWYITTAPLVMPDNVFLIGAGKKGSRIHNNTTSLFKWDGTVFNSSFQNIYLSTGVNGGHAFELDGDAGLSLSSMIDCNVFVDSTTSSIWRQHSTGTSGGNTVDTLFSSCEFSRPQGSLVPAFDVVTTRPVFNSVTFQRVRAHGHNTTAAPFFHIENASGGVNSNVNLTFDGVTGEQNGGGFMHFYDCNGITINDCPDWDYNFPYQDDIYKFASSGANGSGCWNVHMVNSFSLTGDMIAGKYNINAVDTKNRNIIIFNPDASDSRIADIAYNENVTIHGSQLGNGARHLYTDNQIVKVNNGGSAQTLEQTFSGGNAQSLILPAGATTTNKFSELKISGETYPRLQWNGDGTTKVSDGTVTPLPGMRFSGITTASGGLPPASATYRGVVAFVNGGESADQLHICRNGGTGVGYQWIQLT